MVGSARPPRHVLRALCCSLHYTAGPDAGPPPSLALAQAYASLSAGCSALAGAIASGAQGASSALVAQGEQPLLSHVSCYGMRPGAGGESVAWVSLLLLLLPLMGSGTWDSAGSGLLCAVAKM